MAQPLCDHFGDWETRGAAGKQRFCRQNFVYRIDHASKEAMNIETGEADETEETKSLIPIARHNR